MSTRRSTVAARLSASIALAVCSLPRAPAGAGRCHHRDHRRWTRPPAACGRGESVYVDPAAGTLISVGRGRPAARADPRHRPTRSSSPCCPRSAAVDGSSTPRSGALRGAWASRARTPLHRRRHRQRVQGAATPWHVGEHAGDGRLPRQQGLRRATPSSAAFITPPTVVTRRGGSGRDGRRRVRRRRLGGVGGSGAALLASSSSEPSPRRRRLLRLAARTRRPTAERTAAVRAHRRRGRDVLRRGRRAARRRRPAPRRAGPGRRAAGARRLRDGQEAADRMARPEDAAP